MKKYKMLIFDMDGTILYTLEDLKNTTNYALSEHGFPERTLEEVRQFVGNGIHKLIERAVPPELQMQTSKPCSQHLKSIIKIIAWIRQDHTMGSMICLQSFVHRAI